MSHFGVSALRGASLATITLLLAAMSSTARDSSNGPGPVRAVAGTSSTVIGAVGDMACDPADRRFHGGAGTATACAESRTSDAVVADNSLVAVLGLGDYQYVCGDAADYEVSYNPSWGRVDAIMSPVAGNHEYQTGADGHGATCPGTNTTAQNYFNHFGASAHASTGGHFSFDLGAWHLIGLNGNCGKSGVGGCSATSAQSIWLKNDLAATRQPCIAAFWHQPLFTAYQGANAVAYRPWWNLLYAARADLVLNGHVHNYQRYAASNPAGGADSSAGITEYVVGTGGEDLFDRDATLAPQPQVFLKSFGYLRLDLQPAGWTAQFVDAAGVVRDSSSGSCH